VGARVRPVGGLTFSREVRSGPVTVITLNTTTTTPTPTHNSNPPPPPTTTPPPTSPLDSTPSLPTSPPPPPPTITTTTIERNQHLVLPQSTTTTTTTTTEESPLSSSTTTTTTATNITTITSESDKVSQWSFRHGIGVKVPVAAPRRSLASGEAPNPEDIEASPGGEARGMAGGQEVRRSKSLYRAHMVMPHAGQPDTPPAPNTSPGGSSEDSSLVPWQGSSECLLEGERAKHKTTSQFPQDTMLDRVLRCFAEEEEEEEEGRGGGGGEGGGGVGANSETWPPDQFLRDVSLEEKQFPVCPAGCVTSAADHRRLCRSSDYIIPPPEAFRENRDDSNKGSDGHFRLITESEYLKGIKSGDGLTRSKDTKVEEEGITGYLPKTTYRRSATREGVRSEEYLKKGQAEGSYTATSSIPTLTSSPPHSSLTTSLEQHPTRADYLCRLLSQSPSHKHTPATTTPSKSTTSSPRSSPHHTPTSTPPAKSTTPSPRTSAVASSSLSRHFASLSKTSSKSGTPPLSRTATPPLSRTGTPPLSRTATPPLSRTATPSLSRTATPPLSRTATPPSKTTIPPLSRTVSPPVSRTTSPLSRTASPLSRTATPPSKTAPPPFRTATPPLSRTTSPLSRTATPPLSKTATPLSRTSPLSRTATTPSKSSTPPSRTNTPPSSLSRVPSSSAATPYRSPTPPPSSPPPRTPTPPPKSPTTPPPKSYSPTLHTPPKSYSPTFHSPPISYSPTLSSPTLLRSLSLTSSPPGTPPPKPYSSNLNSPALLRSLSQTLPTTSPVPSSSSSSSSAVSSSPSSPLVSSSFPLALNSPPPPTTTSSSSSSSYMSPSTTSPSRESRRPGDRIINTDSIAQQSSLVDFKSNLSSLLGKALTTKKQQRDFTFHSSKEDLSDDLTYRSETFHSSKVIKTASPPPPVDFTTHPLTPDALVESKESGKFKWGKKSENGRAEENKSYPSKGHDEEKSYPSKYHTQDSSLSSPKRNRFLLHKMYPDTDDESDGEEKEVLERVTGKNNSVDGRLSRCSDDDGESEEEVELFLNEPNSMVISRIDINNTFKEIELVGDDTKKEEEEEEEGHGASKNVIKISKEKEIDDDDCKNVRKYKEKIEEDDDVCKNVITKYKYNSTTSSPLRDSLTLPHLASGIVGTPSPLESPVVDGWGVGAGPSVPQDLLNLQGEQFVEFLGSLVVDDTPIIKDTCNIEEGPTTTITKEPPTTTTRGTTTTANTTRTIITTTRRLTPALTPQPKYYKTYSVASSRMYADCSNSSSDDDDEVATPALPSPSADWNCSRGEENSVGERSTANISGGGGRVRWKSGSGEGWQSGGGGGGRARWQSGGVGGSEEWQKSGGGGRARWQSGGGGVGSSAGFQSVVVTGKQKVFMDKDPLSRHRSAECLDQLPRNSARKSACTLGGSSGVDGGSVDSLNVGSGGGGGVNRPGFGKSGRVNNGGVSSLEKMIASFERKSKVGRSRGFERTCSVDNIGTAGYSGVNEGSVSSLSSVGNRGSVGSLGSVGNRDSISNFSSAGNKGNIGSRTSSVVGGMGGVGRRCRVRQNYVVVSSKVPRGSITDEEEGEGSDEPSALLSHAPLLQSASSPSLYHAPREEEKEREEKDGLAMNGHHLEGSKEVHKSVKEFVKVHDNASNKNETEEVRGRRKWFSSPCERRTSSSVPPNTRISLTKALAPLVSRAALPTAQTSSCVTYSTGVTSGLTSSPARLTSPVKSRSTWTSKVTSPTVQTSNVTSPTIQTFKLISPTTWKPKMTPYPAQTSMVTSPTIHISRVTSPVNQNATWESSSITKVVSPQSSQFISPSSPLISPASPRTSPLPSPLISPSSHLPMEYQKRQTQTSSLVIASPHQDTHIHQEIFTAAARPVSPIVENRSLNHIDLSHMQQNQSTQKITPKVNKTKLSPSTPRPQTNSSTPFSYLGPTPNKETSSTGSIAPRPRDHFTPHIGLRPREHTFPPITAHRPMEHRHFSPTAAVRNEVSTSVVPITTTTTTITTTTSSTTTKTDVTPTTWKHSARTCQNTSKTNSNPPTSTVVQSPPKTSQETIIRSHQDVFRTQSDPPKSQQKPLKFHLDLQKQRSFEEELESPVSPVSPTFFHHGTTVLATYNFQNRPSTPDILPINTPLQQSARSPAAATAPPLLLSSGGTEDEDDEGRPTHLGTFNFQDSTKSSKPAVMRNESPPSDFSSMGGDSLISLEDGKHLVGVFDFTKRSSPPASHIANKPKPGKAKTHTAHASATTITTQKSSPTKGASSRSTTTHTTHVIKKTTTPATQSPTQYTHTTHITRKTAPSNHTTTTHTHTTHVIRKSSPASKQTKVEEVNHINEKTPLNNKYKTRPNKDSQLNDTQKALPVSSNTNKSDCKKDWNKSDCEKEDRRSEEGGPENHSQQSGGFQSIELRCVENGDSHLSESSGAGRMDSQQQPAGEGDTDDDDLDIVYEPRLTITKYLVNNTSTNTTSTTTTTISTTQSQKGE
ncbi:hypothetical protein Pcinc_043478, partial [Petrolisthes cinctipes]